jgi:hypothetical protein
MWKNTIDPSVYHLMTSSLTANFQNIRVFRDFTGVSQMNACALHIMFIMIAIILRWRSMAQVAILLRDVIPAIDTLWGINLKEKGQPFSG